MGATYEISFTITQHALINSKWTSVAHFTTGDDCCRHGTRNPSIWYNPGSNVMRASIVTLNSLVNLDCPSAAPLGTAAQFIFKLEPNLASCIMTLNGQTTTSSASFEGRNAAVSNVLAYVGDDSHEAASATISDFYFIQSL